jgi:hypothetical protein
MHQIEERTEECVDFTRNDGALNSLQAISHNGGYDD